MPQDLYNMYNSLSVARKQEVYDFVMFLSDKDMPKRKTKKELSAFGALHKYANPALWEKEEGAWQKAVAEKYKKEHLTSDKIETLEDFFRFTENAPHTGIPEPWTRNDLHDNRGL